MIASPVNGVTDFIICLKPSLVPVGKIGVWQGHEIGFNLGRAHWRRGYASEALRAMLPYLFQERALHEIMADVDPRNVASLGVLEKFGFEVYARKERTFCVDGVWVDSTYLRITKERYDAALMAEKS